MVQNFVFNSPARRSALSSAVVAANLDAIGSLNSGNTAPVNPQVGMPWLDTSVYETSGVVYLKIWDGSDWVTFAQYPSIEYSKIARFNVSTPSIGWSFSHNFNKPNVSVQVFDSGGNKINPISIDVSNVNTVVITHAFPVAGSVVVIG